MNSNYDADAQALVQLYARIKSRRTMSDWVATLALLAATGIVFLALWLRDEAWLLLDGLLAIMVALRVASTSLWLERRAMTIQADLAARMKREGSTQKTGLLPTGARYHLTRYGNEVCLWWAQDPGNHMHW